MKYELERKGKWWFVRIDGEVLNGPKGKAPARFKTEGAARDAADLQRFLRED